ncbi:substrate-binding periplasmic protein [Kineococcus arenarius]|uniref:substrate-binding periplasmic protein n=1 Tax=Kineococcus sp. SYSU DK020 TaxID=3383141 RepID=UPI003D7C743E
MSLAAALTACGGSSAGSTVPEDCQPIVTGVETTESGSLTAAFQEYPPYISNKGGTVSGADGEVLKRVAAALCLEVEAKVTSPTAVVESVKNGSADLTLGNWYINEERAGLFELSKPVYADQMAIISPDGVTAISQLEGGTVGTVQGYLWVEDMQAALGAGDVRLYNSEDAVYQDVAAGRIDAGVTTFGGATQAKETNSGDEQIEVMEPDERIAASVGTPRTAALIHKGNTGLREAVDAVIDEMHADGSLEKALTDNGLPASAADVSDVTDTAAATETTAS